MRPILPALTLLLAAAASSSCGSAPSTRPDSGSERNAAQTGEDADSGDRGPGVQDLASMLVERELDRQHAWRYLGELTRKAPGRAVGTASFDRAVHWAEQTMRQIGLVDVHTEPVVVDVWQRGPAEEARLILSDDKVVDLRILAMTGSVPTHRRVPSKPLIGPVVRCATYDSLTSGEVNLKNRIVFVDEGLPQTAVDPCAAYEALAEQMATAASIARRNGALGLLVRSPVLAHDDVPRAVAVRYLGRKMPCATLSPLSADRLRDALMLADSKPPRIEMLIRSSATTTSAIQSSVIGEIRGTTYPDEVVLLTSRLDASDVGQGAHDDGAGAAQVLAAARSILTTGVRPERTIRIALMVHGHGAKRGARAYVRDHAEELHNHIAVLSATRGGFSPRGFSLAADERAVRKVVNAPVLVQTLESYGAGRFEVVTDLETSVLPPFALSRVPVFEMLTDAQRAVDLERSELDTIDRVIGRHLSMGSAFLAYFAASLASPSTISAP